MANKRNPHIGRTIGEYVSERSGKDAKFAAAHAQEFDNLQIAHSVRRLRLAHKLSQAELAERAGTGQPSIARLEAGGAVPRLDLLDRIARAVGKRLDVRFVAAAKGG